MGPGKVRLATALSADENRSGISAECLNIGLESSLYCQTNRKRTVQAEQFARGTFFIHWPG
jgi:hypothetical protein